MTILEAIKANETQVVIDLNGEKYGPKQMVKCNFSSDQVLGEWSVVREPRRVWGNVYRGVLIGSVFNSLDEAIEHARHDREETVEFVEVLPEVK